MLIDWFTVSAQALNFVVLVWLMKRFLYRPIRHTIDEREKGIAAELADADAKRAEARKERDEFLHKNEELVEQRASLLRKAVEEAKVEGRRLMSEARGEFEASRAKHKESLRKDAHDLGRALERRTREEVFAIALKALKDLATTSLEERMGDVFIRRLRELASGAKAELTEALKTASEPALVQSAFELPAEQRALIQEAINQTFSADVCLRFETVPELVSGIELSTNGLKVGWTIASYLASMESGVAELLKEKYKSEPESRPGPS